MIIVTNNHARDVLSWWELSDIEREAFDWEGAEDDSFFRYRGRAYALGEFMRTPDALKPWHGFHADSFYSGVVVKLSDDGESVVAGTVIN